MDATNNRIDIYDGTGGSATLRVRIGKLT